MAKCAKCSAEIAFFSRQEIIESVGTVCFTCYEKHMQNVAERAEINRRENQEIIANREKPLSVQITSYLEQRIATNAEIASVLVVSTPEIVGQRIDKYYDLISSEVVIGTGPISSMLADFSDVFGTTSDAYAEKIATARSIALNKLKEQSFRLGANAVVSAQVQYLVTIKDMFMLSVSGTPVALSAKEA